MSCHEFVASEMAALGVFFNPKVYNKSVRHFVCTKSRTDYTKSRTEFLYYTKPRTEFLYSTKNRTFTKFYFKKSDLKLS